MSSRPWRVLGFVPDSDEEEEVCLDVRETRHSETFRSQTDRRQLDSIVEVLVPYRNSQQLPLHHAFPTELSDDSDLSSPVSDSALSSMGHAAPGGDRFQVPTVVQDADLKSPEHWRVHYTGRTFRPRRSEQLHPYTIEQEKYRQIFRARGLRPVQFQDSPAPALAESRDIDNEYSSEEGSQIKRHSGILQSSSPHLASTRVFQGPVLPEASNSSVRRSSQEHEDEELPDLMSILDKRKRVVPHASSRLLKRPRTVEGSFPSASTLIGSPFVYDVPRSPSPLSEASQLSYLSQDNSKKKLAKAFRMPEPMSTYMPTTHYQRVHEVEPGIPQRIDISDVSDHYSSNFAGESDDSSVASNDIVQEMANKIRGVLPRSFATLDFERQKATSKQARRRDQAAGPPTKENGTKGVARPARIHTKAVRNTSLPVFVESESDEDTRTKPKPAMQLPRPTNGLGITGAYQNTIEDPGILMEEDLIDLMAPSLNKTVSRSKGARRAQTERRQRPHDVSRTDRGEKGSIAKRRRSRPNEQSHTSHKLSRATQQSGTAHSDRHRVGILDITQNEVIHRAVPQFVRIAKRQARKDVKLARSSPSRKHFRLQSEQDTNDAIELLRTWNSLTNQKSNERRDKMIANASQSGIPKHHGLRNDHAEVPRSDRQPANQHRVRNSSGHSAAEHPNNSIPGQRKLQSFVQYRNHAFIRTAQLESLEQNVQACRSRARFSTGLRVSNRQHRHPIQSAEGPRDLVIGNIERTDQTNVQRQGASHGNKPSRSRKRRATKKSHDVQQPRDNLAIENGNAAEAIHSNLNKKYCEKTTNDGCLDEFLRSHSLDYDIKPLPQGTYLDTATFVGSGAFRKIITFTGRDVRVHAGEHSFWIRGREFSWGTWNVKMRGNLQDLFRDCHDDLQMVLNRDSTESTSPNALQRIKAIAETLQHIAHANHKWLHIDDRSSGNDFALVITESLAPMVATTLEGAVAARSSSARESLLTALIGLLFIQWSLCAQAVICTDQKMHEDAKHIISQSAGCLLEILFASEAYKFRAQMFETSHDGQCPARNPNQEIWTEVIVLLYHTFLQIGHGRDFWAVVTQALQQTINVNGKIADLELSWQNLMMLLPLLEFDDCGIAIFRKRFVEPTENWDLLKMVFDHIFKAYSNTACDTHHRVAMNRYVRLWLHRCHFLVTSWGWIGADMMIPILFDFFAKHHFAPLPKEEIIGSPEFLQDTRSKSKLEISPADPSFHMFLKLLAVTLRSMHDASHVRNCRSLVWRCLPNHGRMHRKEDDLKRSDLDALRSQHDLLSTLFVYGPADIRDRLVENMQNLVDHQLSHQEVCRLSVKAFRKLAVFEVENGCSPLPVLVSWFKEMLSASIDQFRMSRARIELQYSNFDPSDRERMSTWLVQSTIESNQAQVLQTIDDLLASLESLVHRATYQTQLFPILQDTKLEALFYLLDDRTSVTGRGQGEIATFLLRVYDRFMAMPSCDPCHESQPSVNEESQDYGEWPEEGTDISFIGDTIFSRLSVMMESDAVHDERITMSYIQTWTRCTALQVRLAHAEWSKYIDDYGDASWARLPSTLAKAEMTPGFYSCVLELDSSAYTRYRMRFLSNWLSVLVAPTSLMQFQGRLTSAILNAASGDPLLKRMPFSRNSEGKFELDNVTIESRRLGMLASFFENIKVASNTSASTSNYTSLINEVMLSMKQYYTAVRDEQSPRPSYTSFVQSVVELLQQYTSRICSINSFFTDAVLFPLPARDPAYIVSKLKSYGENLDHGSARQLISFFHTIFERAAIDGRTRQIALQLEEAMAPGIEGGEHDSLRSVLLEGIFPTYFKHILTKPCGPYIAGPLLSTTAAVFKTLHYKFNRTEAAAVKSVDSMITTVLCELCSATEPLIDQTHLLRDPMILEALAAVVDTASASLIPMNIIRRTSGLGANAMRAVSFLKSVTVFCLQVMLDKDIFFDAVLHTSVLRDVPPRHEKIRQVCRDDMEPRILENWIKDGGQTFWHNKDVRQRSIMLDVEELAEGRKALTSSIEAFHNQLHHLKMY